MPKLGNIVKWTGSENGKTFTHKGQVIRKDKNGIEIQTRHDGQLYYPLSDGNTKIVKSSDDSWMSKVQYGTNPVETNYTPKPFKAKIVTPRKKRDGGPTKTERAYDLYCQQPDITRTDCIELFVNELDMTPAGASTYVANSRKRYAAEH